MCKCELDTYPRKPIPLRIPPEGHRWIEQEAKAHGMKPADWLCDWLPTEIHWWMYARYCPNTPATEDLTDDGLVGMWKVARAQPARYENNPVLLPIDIPGKHCKLKMYQVVEPVHSLVMAMGGAPMIRALIEHRINHDPDYENVDWRSLA